MKHLDSMKVTTTSQPQYTQHEQPVCNDAQLSSQEPPPSYDDVTPAANPTQQIPVVMYVTVEFILSNLH